VPASLLPFKTEWQAIANGLPCGDTDCPALAGQSVAPRPPGRLAAHRAAKPVRVVNKTLPLPRGVNDNRCPLAIAPRRTALGYRPQRALPREDVGQCLDRRREEILPTGRDDPVDGCI
jgi:hypothetical protein